MAYQCMVSLASSPSTNQSPVAPVKEAVFQTQCVSFLNIYKWVVLCRQYTNSPAHPKMHQKKSQLFLQVSFKITHVPSDSMGVSVDSSGWEMEWKELVHYGFGVLWNTLTGEILPMLRAEMLAKDWFRYEWDRKQTGSQAVNDWQSWQRLAHIWSGLFPDHKTVAIMTDTVVEF